MTIYEITFAASAKREFRDLSPDVIDRIRPKVRELANDPGPPGCKKLHGYKNRWRIRIGDYRIVYSIDDPTKIVDVARIAHRREIYD